MKQIKICGLTSIADIQYVNAHCPEYVGFVFANSRRQVSLQQAKVFRRLLDSKIQAVGVFQDAPLTSVVEAVACGCINLVQLHGQEDATYIAEIKKRVNCKVIKAIPVTQASDLENIAYDVDYYLLDHAQGGSGVCFDWRYLIPLDKPCFLAGGITLANVEAAMVLPVYGIDVSSGVETKGIKDKDKIKQLIRRIRNESR